MWWKLRNILRFNPFTAYQVAGSIIFQSQSPWSWSHRSVHAFSFFLKGPQLILFYVWGGKIKNQAFSVNARKHRLALNRIFIHQMFYQMCHTTGYNFSWFRFWIRLKSIYKKQGDDKGTQEEKRRTVLEIHDDTKTRGQTSSQQGAWAWKPLLQNRSTLSKVLSTKGRQTGAVSKLTKPRIG